MNDLSIIAINIDGVSDKFDNIECINFLSMYDIVILFEAKCTQRVSVSGFESIRSSLIAGEDMRGGTIVLLKHNLWSCLYDVHRYKDQVWFSLSCVAELCFGAVYTTPSDLPYFSPQSSAFVRNECKMYS